MLPSFLLMHCLPVQRLSHLRLALCIYEWCVDQCRDCEERGVCGRSSALGGRSSEETAVAKSNDQPLANPRLYEHPQPHHTQHTQWSVRPPAAAAAAGPPAQGRGRLRPPEFATAATAHPPLRPPLPPPPTRTYHSTHIQWNARPPTEAAAAGRCKRRLWPAAPRHARRSQRASKSAAAQQGQTRLQRPLGRSHSRRDVARLPPGAEAASSWILDRRHHRPRQRLRL